MTSSVAGLMTPRVRPLSAWHHSPLMNRRVSSLVMGGAPGVRCLLLSYAGFAASPAIASPALASRRNEDRSVLDPERFARLLVVLLALGHAVVAAVDAPRDLPEIAPVGQLVEAVRL